MKQLSSVTILDIDGGTRISVTYDDIDDSTGNIISTNNKLSFYVVDSTLMGHVTGVREYIRENKLNS